MTKSHKLALRSILIALIIVQANIPILGYIPLIVVNITLIHITVIVASCILSVWDGILLGLIWGVVKVIIAYSAPQSLMDTLIFQNPFVTIIPKVAIGFGAGFTFKWLNKYLNSNLAALFAGIIGSLTNTFTMLSCMVLFKHDELLTVYHASSDSLNNILLSIISINGIPEAIVSALLVPIFVRIINIKMQKYN